MNARTKSALLVLAVSLVCIALLELVSALMFKRAPMNSGKRLVLSAVENGGRYTWVRDGLVIPHPYLLYVARPGYHEFGFTQVNSLGYRGHEIARDKPAGTYRILCLGGSTTFSFPFIKDPDRAWPGLIETELNRRYPDRRFEVINAGLPYATSAELLAGYMFRHRYLEPDMVIFHEGGNDGAPAFYEDYNPEYTHFRAAGMRILTGRVERTLLHSNIFRVFYMRYWRNVPTIYVAEPYDADDLDRAEALERVEQTYPLGFERNLDLLVRTAKADGARVLLVGFVQAREENLARNWPWRKGLEPASALATRKNLAVMEAIARAHDVPYLSPADVHFKDEWFVDGVHLNQDGENAKAEWILGGVVNVLEGSP